jgi:AraC-like DNA-binding protein
MMLDRPQPWTIKVFSAHTFVAMPAYWNRVVDPLGEVLHSLRMDSSLYTRSEFTAPWGLALPPFPEHLMLHVVTAGGAWLELEGHQPRELRPGDLALVPHGRGHRLVSQPGAAAAELFDLPREQVSERYEIVRHGGGGPATTMICGVVRFHHPTARELVKLLPGMIVVDGGAAHPMVWVHSTLRFLTEEARELRPGGETVITRLADILVIQAIRSWVAGEPDAQTGWLRALRDPQIGRAISLIHRQPARSWTLASLAAEVAMSRSAFAARFAHLVGETAMRYVARSKMQIALQSLKNDGARIGELASRLGYQSEAAFSRAFKRVVGVSPGAARAPGRRGMNASPGSDSTAP